MTSCLLGTLRYTRLTRRRPCRIAASVKSGTTWSPPVVEGLSLTGVQAAVRNAAYKLEPGPDFIHRTDFHIYQALRQAKFPNHVLGKVGIGSSCTLSPGDPEYSFVRERT